MSEKNEKLESKITIDETITTETVSEELPLIEPGDPIPEGTEEEFENGKGE